MVAQDFFNIAQNHFNDALPFVLYSMPNTSIVKGIYQENDTVYYSKNLTESGFVFAPFNVNDNSILIPKINSETFQMSFQNTLDQEQNTLEKESIVGDKKFHLDLVSRAIKEIKNNTLEKVVVSRKEELNLLEKKPIKLFKKMLKQYKTAFVYCWYHPKIGLWLGATPETLLSVTGNRFSTMALAGTQAYKGIDNPVWRAKETSEQQLVTNYLVSNLKPIVSTLKTGELETIKAGNLLHLRTKVSGVFNSNLQEIVNALHPTPAVCGLPKKEAKKFILENENYNREFYTGFLGEINLKEKKSRNSNRRNVENSAYNTIKTVTNLFVNLRCMQLTDEKASIYVGGGITKDSNAEQEWIETVNKTQTMKKVLY